MVRADNRNPSHETPDPVWYAHYAGTNPAGRLVTHRPARACKMHRVARTTRHSWRLCCELVSGAKTISSSRRPAGARPDVAVLNGAGSIAFLLLVSSGVKVVCPISSTPIRPARRLLRRLRQHCARPPARHPGVRRSRRQGGHGPRYAHQRVFRTPSVHRFSIVHYSMDLALPKISSWGKL